MKKLSGYDIVHLTRSEPRSFQAKCVVGKATGGLGYDKSRGVQQPDKRLFRVYAIS